MICTFDASLLLLKHNHANASPFTFLIDEFYLKDDANTTFASPCLIEVFISIHSTVRQELKHPLSMSSYVCANLSPEFFGVAATSEVYPLIVDYEP